MNLTEEKIYKLHQKYAQNENILNIVWIHSQIIKEIAVLICKDLKQNHQIEVDVELVKVGALIHDIGFYKCFDKHLTKTEDKIKHGQFGYEIFKKEKVSETISRFALTHIGTGITKKHIKNQNLPLKKIDQIPITLEEEIVCYSDIFHSKHKDSFNTFEKISKKWKNISDEEIIVLNRFRIKFGIPKLEGIKNKYEEKYKNFFEN